MIIMGDKVGLELVIGISVLYMYFSDIADLIGLAATDVCHYNYILFYLV